MPKYYEKLTSIISTILKEEREILKEERAIQSKREVQSYMHQMDFEELSRIEKLPDEMLGKIFSYLPAKDLLTAALVCKRFNTVISTSTPLMKQFKIKFEKEQNKKNKEQNEKEWIGSRRYSRVSISNIDLRLIFPKIEKIKDSITDLEIICDNLDLERLQDILNACINLKKLWINVSYSTVGCVKSPPNLKLNELVLNLGHGDYFEKIFKLFTNSTYKAIVFFSKNVYPPMFCNHPEIESLTTSSKSNSFDKLANQNLRLKKFIYHDIYETFDEENYCKFLETQKDTLEEYSTTGGITDGVAKILNKFKKLRKLTVSGEVSKEYIRTDSIKEFTMFGIKSFELNQFPFVKDLTIEYRKDLTGIENLKNLERLSLKRCKVKNMKIPTVKHLILDDCIWKGDKPFDQENLALETLEVKTINKPPKWLVELLNRNETKLSLLKMVFRKKVTDETRKLIAEYSHKIKKVQYFLLKKFH